MKAQIVGSRREGHAGDVGVARSSEYAHMYYQLRGDADLFFITKHHVRTFLAFNGTPIPVVQDSRPATLLT